MNQSITAKARILVVDDEPAARTALGELLRDEGFEVHSAGDGFKAIGRVDGWTPDVVITDLKMPGMDGTELMEKLRERIPDVSVVVMTAFGSIETAVEAMQRGADDYLTKPIQLTHLMVVLQRVLEHRRVRKEAEQLREALAEQSEDRFARLGLIGRSKPFRDMLELVGQVADSDASVLLLGESGTGKGLVAMALHQFGPRREGPFVSINCSAFDEKVLEVELFGCEPDAFPGVTAQRDGKLLQANGGVLYLDDIAGMPAAVQIKLLRFLQERTFERVGGGEALTANVRIVSSSERDLHDQVDKGRFREDLYFRLNVVTLRVPTLRERREDIPLLADHFLRRFARANSRGIDGFADRALGVLLNFDWPGNIQQLENCIERAVVLCKHGEIEPRHLPRELMGKARNTEDVPHIPGATLRELEKFAILKTLEHVGGSTSKAARMLGISPRKIQYRLNEYREEDPSGVPVVGAGVAAQAARH